MGVLDDRIAELTADVAGLQVAVAAAIAAFARSTPSITTEQEEALARLGLLVRDATEDLTTATPPPA